jgi:hypothetical protein
MSGNLIDCLPDGTDLAVIGTRISERIAGYLPSEIALSDLTSSQIVRPTTIEAIERLRLQVQIARSGTSMAFRIAILALSLYALLNSSSIMRLTKSLRLPLYMASGLTLLLLGVAYALLEYGLPYLASSGFKAFGSDIQALILDFVGRLGGEGIKKWAKLGLAMLGLAVAIHIAGTSIARSAGEAQEIRADREIRRSRIRKEFR